MKKEEESFKILFTIHGLYTGEAYLTLTLPGKYNQVRGYL
jgi:hypothetical protein